MYLLRPHLERKSRHRSSASIEWCTRQNLNAPGGKAGNARRKSAFVFHLRSLLALWPACEFKLSHAEQTRPIEWPKKVMTRQDQFGEAFTDVRIDARAGDMPEPRVAHREPREQEGSRATHDARLPCRDLAAVFADQQALAGGSQVIRNARA